MKVGSICPFCRMEVIAGDAHAVAAHATRDGIDVVCRVTMRVQYPARSARITNVEPTPAQPTGDDDASKPA